MQTSRRSTSYGLAGPYTVRALLVLFGKKLLFLKAPEF